MFTGAPEISVPIASVKGRDITLPIALTYDASGVKVEQISSWVGIGWNLSAGGAITRQANGSPDDYLSSSPAYTPFYAVSNGDFQFVNANNLRETQTYPAGDIARYLNFMKLSLGTTVDTQPDVYQFHVNGLSGTIYIDYTTGVGYCAEHPELKVYPEITPSGNGGVIKLITGWHLVDQAGTTYYFQNAEKTTVFDFNANDNMKQYYSSWYLTKIVTANNRDVVEVAYSAPILWTQPQLAGRGDTFSDLLTEGACGTDQYNVAPVPMYQITQADIATIRINGTLRVRFNASADMRQDLGGKYALNNIQVYAEDGSLLKTFKLSQSYFTNGTPADEKDYRLRLDAVEIIGGNLAVLKGQTPSDSQPLFYKFTYYGAFLPSRKVFGDYWGYNNGLMNTGPYAFPYLYDYDKNNGMLTGADRRPSFTDAKLGTLYQITYPTGGSTIFDYIEHRSDQATYTEHAQFSAGASLQGGIDPNDSFGYRVCDDRFGLNPVGVNSGFTITEAAMYNVTFVANGTFHTTNDFQFASLYKTIDKGAPDKYFYQTFCSVLQGGGGLHNWYGAYTTYTETISLYLTPGKYAILLLNSNPQVNAGIVVSRDYSVDSYRVGGLRVYKTTDKTEEGAVARLKYYYYGDLSQLPASTPLNEDFFALQTTSGSLHQQLNYEEWYAVSQINTDPNNINYPVGAVMPCDRLIRYSTNQTKANYLITYPTVTEVEYDPVQSVTNGFTVTDFFNRIDNYLYAYDSKTSLNGKVLETRIYDGNFNLLSSETNSYSETVLHGTERTGFVFKSLQKVAKDIAIVNQGATGSPEYYVYSNLGLAQFQNDPENPTNTGNIAKVVHCTGSNYPVANQVNCYYGPSDVYNKFVVSLAQRWPRLDNVRHEQYAGTQVMAQVNNYYYDNPAHYQLTRVARQDGKGVVTVDRMYYPSDLSSPALAAMVAQNRVSEVVKYEHYTNGQLTNDVITNNGTLTETKYTEYSAWNLGGNTLYLPQTTQLSTYSNPLEVRVRYAAYDNVGNPLTVSKENDNRFSYLWDNYQMNPVAMVSNSAGATCYYNGFEDGTSSDGDALTGMRSLISSSGFTQTLSSVVSGNYVLSYWQKTGTAWYLQSQNVTVSNSTYVINIPGPVQLDELRFQPAGSQMTTYSYVPGIGVSSVSDANGMTLRYYYDDFGRVKTMKDHNNKVLKTYRYHYRE